MGPGIDSKNCRSILFTVTRKLGHTCTNPDTLQVNKFTRNISSLKPRIWLFLDWSLFTPARVVSLSCENLFHMKNKVEDKNSDFRLNMMERKELFWLKTMQNSLIPSYNTFMMLDLSDRHRIRFRPVSTSIWNRKTKVKIKLVNRKVWKILVYKPAIVPKDLKNYVECRFWKLLKLSLRLDFRFQLIREIRQRRYTFNGLKHM